MVACSGRRSRATARRSRSSATSASGRTTSRRGQPKQVADHAARFAGRPGCRARDADERPPGARALARREEGRVRRARRDLRRVGQGWRRRGARHDDAGAEEQLAWAPDSRRLAYVERSRWPVASVTSTTSPRAPRRNSRAARRATSRRAGRRTGSRIAFVRGGTRSCTWSTSRPERRRELAAAWRSSRPPFVDDARSPGRPTASGSRTRRAWARSSSPTSSSCRSSGGEPRPVSLLSNANGGGLSWSPDGTFLSLASGQRTEDGQAVRIDLVPRTPRFREDQFRDLFGANVAAASAGPQHPAARTRRARRRTRDPVDTTDSASRTRQHGAPRSEHAPSSSTTSVVAPTALARRRRCRRRRASAPTARRCCSPRRAAGQTNLYTYSLDELAQSEPSRAAHVHARLQERRAVVARRKGECSTSRMGASTPSTSSRAPCAAST